MSDKQIAAVQPVWGQLGSGNAEQKLVQAFNNSGVQLFHGDVVIVDSSVAQMPTLPVPAGATFTGATGAVKTTTTAADPLVLGVVSITGDANTNGQAINPGGTMYVCVFGVARVNIGAATVALGGQLESAAIARQAAVGTAAIGAVIGQALEANTAKDVNNTIRVFVKIC